MVYHMGSKYYLTMRRSHAYLLRLYHDPHYDFSKVSLDYTNRGAPDDRSTICGDHIHHLRAGGMEIDSAWGTIYIPYHRILRILYEGQMVWEKSVKIVKEG
jgi:uncharacterized protein (UPF0248 family)